MTIGDFLNQATARLRNANIETARLDTLVLLEDTLKQDRSLLLAHPEQSIPDRDFTKLNYFITQRISHTPLAYIRGKAMFYGREFIVNNQVLVPRAETETLIDLLKSSPLSVAPYLVDIGTGSGCIGITAALELPGSQVVLVDNDPSALTVAKKNVEQFNLSVQLKLNDLLEGLAEQKFDAILANLPYVPQTYAINKAATFEPPQALFSGADGLDHYRKLWQELAIMTAPPRYIFTESMPDQHKALAGIARQAGYMQDTTQDFIQRFVLRSATED